MSSQRRTMGSGACCHLEVRREVRVRALEGERSGGGNSVLWERVDTMVTSVVRDQGL